jgi:uncharacterized membrane protein YtjA (UPF0391 family)
LVFRILDCAAFSANADRAAADRDAYAAPPNLPPLSTTDNIPKELLPRHRVCFSENNEEVPQMGNLFYYAIMFLIIALVAAALGFGGVAGTAMAGAKVLFWVAIIIFVIMLVAGVVRR